MRKSYAKYLASLLLFGSNGIVVSGISLPSHEIALVRTVLGALLLFACLAIGGKKLSLHRSRRDFLFVAASGFALGISWIFVYMAYRTIGVAVSSLLYALGPVFLIALSPLLFGSKVTGKMTVGLAVVLLGIVLVNGGLNAASSNVEGVAYGLAAAGCYAAMVAFSKKADAACGLERSAVQLASAALAVLAAIVVLGMPLEMPASSDILPALVLGLVNTGVGCYLYFSVIAELPTGTVAACSYLEPLSAVMLSAAVLNEPLGVGQWIGGALVIAGALFCELSGRMKPLRLRLPVLSAHMPKHEAFFTRSSRCSITPLRTKVWLAPSSWISCLDKHDQFPTGKPVALGRNAITFPRGNWLRKHFAIAFLWGKRSGNLSSHNRFPAGKRL